MTLLFIMKLGEIKDNLMVHHTQKILIIHPTFDQSIFKDDVIMMSKINRTKNGTIEQKNSMLTYFSEKRL